MVSRIILKGLCWLERKSFEALIEVNADVRFAGT
jgi:hypothetical protein